MIHIVGIGTGRREDLSRRAIRAIETARTLVGGRRHLDLFPEFKGEKVLIGSDLEEVAQAIERRLDSPIAVLATGDPCFFGIARFLLKRFGKERIEIIPGVTVMQEAFARIKETWEDARFFSLHGRKDLNRVVEDICGWEKVGIFTDPDNTPSRIARTILERGGPSFRVYVCENLGMEDERIREGSLEEIAGMDFSPLNVMILLKEKPACISIIGIPEERFLRKEGMITKEEVRSVVMGKLSLFEDSVLWDIGAGSGSVGIEAARLARKGRVYAIERDREALSLIERNRRGFGLSNLTVIHGEAPEALKGLPRPDSVFIGGSGGRLREILLYVLKEVKRGGRIVANFATLDNLFQAIGLLKGEAIPFQIVEVSIRRGEGLGGMVRLKPLDPVFILTAEVG